MWIALTLNFIFVLIGVGLILKGRGPALLKRFEPAEVVADLDAIANRTVAFRFEGRTYKIPPVTSLKFFYAMNAMAELEQLKFKKVINESELLDRYEALFKIVCPSCTRCVLSQMSHQQIGAIWNLLIAQISGKPNLADEKKSHLSVVNQTG